MAVRTDIFSIDYTVSPRVIWIDISIQYASAIDLYDTVSYIHSQPEAMDEAHIIDAEGLTKLDEDGNKVGITVILINALYAFAPRTNWIICNMQGGNVVAFTDITRSSTLYPRLPTAFVSADRTSSVSATLQEQNALQYSSYGGVVSVDVTATNIHATGLEYPSGNKEFPVDNVANGVLIAWDKGIDTLELRGTHVLTDGDNPTELKLRGQNKILSNVNVEASSNVLNCEFSKMTISGTLDGGSLIEKCDVGALNYVNGEIFKSTLQEFPIVLGGDREARIVDCYSGVSGNDTAKIDMAGEGQSLLVRNFSGGCRILNKTGTDNCSLDFNSGHCIIDSTCVGSPIIVRGVCKLTVENGATQPLIDGKAVMIQDDIAAQVWKVELS